MKTKVKERVRIDEIGLYLRTIQAEYAPKDNQEMADLISHHFNVICLVEDIEHYEQLHEEYNEIVSEDFELISRREDYFRRIGRDNPFY